MKDQNGNSVDFTRAMAPDTAPAPMSPQKHPKADELWMAANIMPRHRTQRVDWTRNQAWSEKTRTLIDRYHAASDLMAGLIGPRGTGKTQAAIEVIRAAVWSGRSARYCTAMDFFRAIKSTFRSDTDEAEVFGRFITPGVLVLDEVQVRSSSEWENNQLTHLVDKRYGNMMATIFIGNFDTADSFKACVGDSIYSRLAETGSIFLFSWQSWRDPSLHQGAHGR